MWFALVAAALAQAPLSEVELVPPRLVAPLEVAWPLTVEPTEGPQTVTFDLLVGTDGAVLEAELIEGRSPFAEAARAAVLGTRLEPAREAGEAVSVRVPLTVTITPPPLSLEGNVRLGGGGAPPVAGARVWVGELCDTTDEAGSFSFFGLAVGSSFVRVESDGLRVEPLAVVVAAGEVVTVQLWAVPEVVDVGILGLYRSPAADVQRRTLDAAFLRAMPGTLGDPLRAVANLPGTQRSPLDTGWLLVRGADPLHTTVSIDGVRVPLVYHVGGYTSVIHPAFVDAVAFVPGGGGARYGRGLAGMVDVETRAPSPMPEVRGGANLVFAGAFAEVPTPVGSFALAARRSYLDAVLAPLLPESAAGSIPTFWDWQARAAFEGGTRLFGLGFSDALHVAADDGSAALLELGTQRLHVAHSVPVGSRELKLAPFLAWEHLRFEVEDWGRESRRDHVGGGLRAEVPDPGTGSFNGGGGLDAEAFWASVRADEVQRTATVVMPDLWGEARFGRVSTAVVGLRADTLFVEGQPARLAPGPRFAGHWQIAPRAALDVELGGHHQPPPWEVLLVLPDAASLELDEAWEGSVRGELGKGPWELGLEGFGRYSPRLTGFEADGSLGQGEGVAWGVEASASVRLGRFEGLARVGGGESGRRDEPEEAWHPALYDQRFTAGVVGTVALPKLWSVAGRFRAADGYWLEEESVEVFDALRAAFVTVHTTDSRTDAFVSLDLKVSKRWVFRTWRLDAWLDVQNVTNHRVPERVVTGFADLPISELAWGFVTLPVFGVEASWQGDPRRP